MDGNSYAVQVLGRTLGPPCSNIITFCVEEHPGVTYCAYALSDGAIIIQQSLPPTSPATAPSSSSQPSRPSRSSASSLPPTAAAALSGSGQFVPVLLIDGVALDHGAECFRLVSWGGGPEGLLAAATRQHVYFFSLLPFFQDPSARPGPSPSGGPAAPTHLPAPSTAFHLLGLYRTAMPATALAFSHNARGLLLTDAGNYVTMLQLVPKELLPNTTLGSTAATTLPVPGSSQQQQYSRQLWARLSRTGPGAAGGDGGVGGSAGGGVPPPGVAMAVHEAWRVRGDATHTLAAASVDCYSPCATTTTMGGGGGGGGAGGPHKVTIWWPSRPKGDAAVPRSRGGSGSGDGHHPQHEAPAVGAEIVRHPVRVLSLEWSPPLADTSRGHGGGSGSNHAYAGDGSSSSSTSAAAAAAVPSASSLGATAAPTQQPPHAATASAVSAPSAGHPPAAALMTLGADWVIRIYVEVVMQNMLPPELAVTAPGLSMSQFCLTLVIEPPSLNLTPATRPGMRACWARPLGPGGGGGGVGAGGAASAGAVTGMGVGGEGNSGGEDAAGGSSSSEQQQQLGPGGGGGSRLQWIVASVGMVASDDVEPHENGPHGGGGASMLPLEEAVCVWAVDGLSAVVLSGMPRGSVSSAKTTASPKAVLWGVESRSVSWLQPAKLLPPGAPAPDSLRHHPYAISAYVAYPGGMPLLQAADSCAGMQGAYTEVRSYQICPTATTTPGGRGQTATFLRISGLARQAMTGSPESIASMLVHPVADVALLRDRTGGVALWCLAPLCELPLGIAPAAASAFRVLLAAAWQLAAVTWLSCCSRVPAAAEGDGRVDGNGGGGGDGDVVAYLACIHGRRLLVYALQLPHAALGAWPASAANAAGEVLTAAAASWGAMFVSEVLRLELPEGVSAVRWLHEASYAPCEAGAGTSAGAAIVTLVALARQTPTPSDGTSGKLPAAAAHSISNGDHKPSALEARLPLQQEVEDADVWLTWRIRVQPPCPTTGLRIMELSSQRVDAVAATLTSGPMGQSATRGSPLSRVSCCAASLAAPVVPLEVIGCLNEDSGGVGGSISAQYDNSARQGTSASVSSASDCGSVESGSVRVPCLMSGTSDGYVQFWRPLPDAAGNGGGGSISGCGLELVQSLLCRSRRFSGGEGAALAVSTLQPAAGGDESYGRPRVGAAIAGVVVAVALDQMNGYAAAATTCGGGVGGPGEEEEEEALYVWRLAEEVDDDVQDPNVRCSGGLNGEFELDAVVPVSDTVSALSWLAAGGLSPCLAVGYASGRVVLLLRERTVGWSQVAAYGGSAAVVAFGSARGGVVPMAAGNHLLCFSNVMSPLEPRPTSTLAPTLAALAADSSGALPPYHPGSLHALVAKGKLSTTCRILRRLLNWLREGTTTTSSSSTSGDGKGGAAAEPLDLEAVNREGECHRPIGQWDDRASVRSVIGRAPLVVDLQELLCAEDLVTCRGMAAFQQLLTAPPPPPAAESSRSVLSAGWPTQGSATARPVTAAPFRSPVNADDGSGPLRPLPGVSASEWTGLRQQDPLGGAGRSVVQPSASGALSTGELDMSAFGGGLTSGGGSRASPPAGIVPKPAPPPLASGMLDMSAFGGDFAGGWAGPSSPPRRVAPPPPPPPPQRSALESGALDLSAFGGFGTVLHEPPVPHPPPSPPHSATPPPPNGPGSVPDPEPSSLHAALETGVLDMSAFGDFVATAATVAVVATPSRQASAGAAALETTTSPHTNTSALGAAFGSLMVEQRATTGLSVPLPAGPNAAPATATTTTQGSLDTGMLDMSAFSGEFGEFAAVAPPPPPPPPAPAPPPPPPHPPGSDPLHTGVLDFSAFGSFGDFMPPEDDPPSPQQQPQPQQQQPPNLRSHSQPAPAGPMKGPTVAPMLPLSGAAATATTSPSLCPGYLEGAARPSGSTSLLISPTVSVSRLAPATTPHAYDPTTVTTTAAATAAATPGASGPIVPAAGSPPAASVTSDAAWVVFPRVPEPATPADALLPELLLDAAEVAELHRLLGQNPPALRDAKSGSAGGGDGGGTVKSGSMAREDGCEGDDGAAASGSGSSNAVADAVAALSSLGLTPEDGGELCRLAAALSRRSVGQQQPGAALYGNIASAGGGGGSGEGTMDVMVGLDYAARAFLVQTRVAAEAVYTATATNADGVADDGAFAAAVSKLFRPVSVSRAPSRTVHDQSSPSTATADPSADFTALTPAGVQGPSRAPSGPLESRGGHHRLMAAAGPGGGVLGGRGPHPHQQLMRLGHGAAPGVAIPYGVASSYSQLPHSAGAPSSRTTAPGHTTPGGPRAGVPRSRSVRSVMSVLSFSSLPESLYGPGDGRVSDVDGYDDEDDVDGGGGGGSSRSWWRVCGLLPGLEMRSCLAALSSGTQGQLVEAVLPAVPWVAAVDEEVSAAPEGGRGGRLMGGGAGPSGGSDSSNAPPRPALSWPLLRKAGAGFWLADPRVVREQAEALAKAQFARRKEPYDCTLMYLALGRKALLLSLFRQASNLKIADFLLRDFNQPEPRRSAAKNAFALLGQHRYELAAAFFILAGQPYDAVSVLVRERRDPQLALLVARLLDPPGPAPGGPLARRLIEQELMPLAMASRDPCAVAVLEVLSGQPTRAVLHLLARSSGAAALATIAPPTPLDPSVAQSATSPPSHAQPSESSSSSTASSALRSVDAAALDCCLRLGVQYLSGRPVPACVGKWLRRLALETSRALEHAGLAAAALEALRVATALQTNGKATGGGERLLSPALTRRYNRLLAACLSHGLQEPQQRRQQREGEASGGLAAAAAATLPECGGRSRVGRVEGEALNWQREARQALSALAPLLGPRVDETAVLRLLSRHINALKRVRHQPVVPPELLMSRTRPPPPPSSASPRVSYVTRPSQPSRQPPDQPMGPGRMQSGQFAPLTQSSGQGGAFPSTTTIHRTSLTAYTVHNTATTTTFAAAAVGPQGQVIGGAAGGNWDHDSLVVHSSWTAGNNNAVTASLTSQDGSQRTAYGPMGHSQPPSGQSYPGAVGRPPQGPSAFASAASQPPYPHAAYAQQTAPSQPSQSYNQPVAQAPLLTRPPHQQMTPPASPLSYSSSPSASEGARRSVVSEGSATAGAGGGGGSSSSGGPSGWGVFEAPWDVLVLEGDRCRSIAVPRGRGPDDNGQLPFTAASARSGLVSGVLGPPALAPPAKAAGPSSLFLGLMQSVLHHVRWTPDPWAMMSGDFADEMAPTAPAAGASGGPSAAGGAAGGGALPGGAAGGLVRSSSPGLPGGGGGGGGGMGSSGPGFSGGISTSALAAHPERDEYLSGSSSMMVYQWRFGEPHAITAYVPCPEPLTISPGAAAVAARSHRNSGGGAAAAAVAASLDLHASHWGHAAALCFSTPGGGRFAGIGEGGLVATWRTDVLGPGGLGFADWTHHCVGKHGRAISFVGDSGSQLLVAGQGDRGGLVGWWDTLAPPSAACVAELRGRRGVPGALTLLRPDAGGVLVFGDESGALVATDLRMMSAREFIWTLPRAHTAPVTAMAQWGPTAPGILTLPPTVQRPTHTPHQNQHPQQPQTARMSNLLVSGAKDGSIVLVDISSGRVVSAVERAHASTRTGLPGLLAAAAASASGSAKVMDRTIVRRSRSASANGVAVSGLVCLPYTGIVSCGADGAVRYHPLAPQLLDLRRG